MDKIREIIERIIEAIKQTLKETPAHRIVGYILFIPMLISLIHLLYIYFNPGESSFIFGGKYIFKAKFGYSRGSYSPYNSIYVGLLALAGAYLIKNDKK